MDNRYNQEPKQSHLQNLPTNWDSQEAQEEENMTDLEMTKCCAEAMGFRAIVQDGSVTYVGPVKELQVFYDPLHDDAQAMALVKHLKLSVGFNGGWGCVKNAENGMLRCGAYHFDSLNRAIVECVAKMTQNASQTHQDHLRAPNGQET